MTLIYTSKHSLNSLSTSQILLHRQRDRHAQNVTGTHNTMRSNGLKQADVLVRRACSLCASITELPFHSPGKPHYEQEQKVGLSITTWLHGNFACYPQCQTNCRCMLRISANVLNAFVCERPQWQPDCTRRQGIGMKANLHQPWPQLYKIIKKKSFADRG